MARVKSPWATPKKGPDATACPRKQQPTQDKKWGTWGGGPQITASNKENPMSLGVLNNLSAVYAENNLNNTDNSLSKTLQQLSSGSRINSGADDAAGLSLVDGLQANQQALTQSETNATEGSGLLQVADGALSQVTSLLNRAVTLATEASNGTLNSSQDTAANQEYQSILSEISNIGSTTTYNQNAVFGTTTNIYAGDSTSAGSSIDSLNIRSLSSSNVGDSSGEMAYTTAGGNGSVWIDMGAASIHSGDFLDAANPGAAGGITVSTLSSTGGTVSTTIDTGSNGVPNTVGGLIEAINDSGLGLTASIATDEVAGAGTTGDEGIMITGSVGVGTAPSTASYSGSLSAAGATTDVLSGSLTITEGSGAATTVSMAEVDKAEGGSTLGDLESYLSADGALGISQSGTTTMGLASANNSTAKLQVSSDLYDTTTGTSLTYTANAAYAAGISNNTAYDKTANQGAAVAAVAGTAGGTGGTATISYTDSAGQSLSSTDLSDQADAQTALTDLNAAITDVAAQDGYIGAQINTLNAVSQVLSTQQENVQSAQNAVQATDYASATSNMSKYEILSQTGISALAQANSQQQEVLKLLQ
jgi:flagellin